MTDTLYPEALALGSTGKCTDRWNRPVTVW